MKDFQYQMLLILLSKFSSHLFDLYEKYSVCDKNTLNVWSSVISRMESIVDFVRDFEDGDD